MLDVAIARTFRCLLFLKPVHMLFTCWFHVHVFDSRLIIVVGRNLYFAMPMRHCYCFCPFCRLRYFRLTMKNSARTKEYVQLQLLHRTAATSRLSVINLESQDAKDSNRTVLLSQEVVVSMRNINKCSPSFCILQPSAIPLVSVWHQGRGCTCRTT